MTRSSIALAALALVCLLVPFTTGVSENVQHQGAVQSREPGVKSAVAQELLRSVGVEEFTQRKLNEVYNEMLRTRDPRLAPYLEERFGEADSYSETVYLAARLVYIGTRDQKYWDYLYGEGRSAVTSGMPNRRDPGDVPGSAVVEELEAFREWREEWGLSAAEARERETEYYYAVSALGATVDRRAVNLLLEGLRAENGMILRGAIQSLARLQEKRAIGPFIDALEKEPRNSAKVLATWLLYFDDPAAHNAAARFIDDPRVFEAMRSHVADQGVEAIYGY